MKANQGKTKTRKQLEEELQELRWWLTMLSRQWIGEAAGIQMLTYTNRRKLTESETMHANVATNHGHELDRVLREVG
jgi:hypothetical protein